MDAYDEIKSIGLQNAGSLTEKRMAIRKQEKELIHIMGQATMQYERYVGDTDYSADLKKAIEAMDTAYKQFKQTITPKK